MHCKPFYWFSSRLSLEHRHLLFDNTPVRHVSFPVLHWRGHRALTFSSLLAKGGSRSCSAAFGNVRLLYLAFGQGVRNTSSNLSYSGEPNFYTGGHCSRFVPFNYLLIALKCVQRSDGVPIPFGMVLLVCSYELHLLPPIILSGLVFAYPHFPFPKCSAPYQLGSHG